MQRCAAPQIRVCVAPCREDEALACAFRDNSADAVAWCNAGSFAGRRVNDRTSAGLWCDQPASDGMSLADRMGEAPVIGQWKLKKNT
jgi:hypothetical protein